jgi:hypothetical protein
MKCVVLTARQIEPGDGILRASDDVVEHQLAAGETTTIPATQRTFFKINTR